MRFALALAGTVAGSVLPDWLEPDVAAKLVAGYAARDVVSGMSSEELAADNEFRDGEDVLDVLMHSYVPIADTKYLGVSNLMDALSADWSVVHEQCQIIIRIFWLVRPDWFAAGIDDILTTRLCIESILYKLENLEANADSSMSTRDWNIIASAVGDIMKPVYAKGTEFHLRSSPAVSTGPISAGFKTFQKYVRESPVILDLLARASSASVMPSLDEFGSLLNEGGNNPLLRHAGDYLDKMWGAAAAEGHGEGFVSLWQNLVLEVDKFDELEFRFDSYKSEIRGDEILWRRLSHYRRGMGLARSAWRFTVGALIDEMILSYPDVMNQCIPEESEGDLFSYLDIDTAEIVPVYRCIADKVAEGLITLQPEPNKVCTLMHMIRMSTNSLAYIVTQTS